MDFIMKDLNKIINETQTSFNDEQIKKLFERYLACDCDRYRMYAVVNNINEDKITENEYLDQLDEVEYKSHSGWNIVVSSEGYLEVPKDIKPEERDPQYRIYLNAKGKDKADIVRGYIEKCNENNLEYRFKYFSKDGRNDEIVILSSSEYFSKNVEIVEQITAGKNLGDLPELVGKYRENIGISEEYENSYISYTESRLITINDALKKYILDNEEKFTKYCTDKEKKAIISAKKLIQSNLEYLEEDMQDVEGNEEEIKKLEKNKLLYENNIEDMSIDTYFCGYAVKEAIIKYMSEHSEEAMPELIANYKFISSVRGFSENVIFSQKTEKLMQQEKYDNKKQELISQIRQAQEEGKKLDEQIRETKEKNMADKEL